MGCDIHCYLEYRQSEREFWEGTGERQWRSFGGRINPGRNYQLFGLLAGVRSGEPPVFALRGVPVGLGYAAKMDNVLYITNEDESADEQGKCTSEAAARWVESGASTYTDWSDVSNYGGGRQWVTHPDWHSHSWLTVEEFRNVLDKMPPIESPHLVEYRAVLAALTGLAEHGEARIVFWFDN